MPQKDDPHDVKDDIPHAAAVTTDISQQRLNYTNCTVEKVTKESMQMLGKAQEDTAHEISKAVNFSQENFVSTKGILSKMFKTTAKKSWLSVDTIEHNFDLGQDLQEKDENDESESDNS